MKEVIKMDDLKTTSKWLKSHQQYLEQAKKAVANTCTEITFLKSKINKITTSIPQLEEQLILMKEQLPILSEQLRIAEISLPNQLTYHAQEEEKVSLGKRKIQIIQQLKTLNKGETNQ